MPDPARFTVEGITFVAAPTKSGLPYYWRPELPGLACSIFKHDSPGGRPYSVQSVRLASLEAAARRAIQIRAAEIEEWRKMIAEFEASKAKLAEQLARPPSRV